MLDAVAALLVGMALAQGPLDAKPAEPPAPVPRCNLKSRLTGPDDPRLERLKGTAEIYARACSAALVTLRGRSKTERGLMLTSGHCVGRGKAQLQQGRRMVPERGEVLYRLKDSRSFTLETGKAEAPRACLATDALLYATMTDVDIAIYQAAETYEEIEQRTGVLPFTIATEVATPPGVLVRAPSALHQGNYTCALDGTVPKLKEMLWTWGPVLRLTKGCDVPPGGSGSPIIREDTGEVVGVLGTVYDADGAPCALMNPCEIGADGTVSVADKGQPYAHLVHQLYSCLDARANIDLGAAGCLLPKPQS